MTTLEDRAAWHEYIGKLDHQYDSAKLQLTALIEKLGRWEIECPAAITTPGDFGGIVLEWNSPSEYLELELHGAAWSWCYFARDTRAGEGEEDVPELPDRVVELVAKFADPNRAAESKGEP